MTGVNEFVRKASRKFGFDIVRFTPEKHPLARRKKILDTYQINMVFDIGANIGQYGKELRDIGYKGRIVSFEPMSLAFNKLKLKSDRDSLWDAHNFALGEEKGTSQINIAGNSYSSSLLDMLPSHVDAAPDSKYTGQEEIRIETLDSIYPSLVGKDDKVYLKLDTQGYEKSVLQGGKSSLRLIETIQLEMSLMPLYKDELLFDQMYDFLYQQGYRLIAVEPGFTDEKTGQLLQLDGIFHRM